jgi:hypothetical protein
MLPEVTCKIKHPSLEEMFDARYEAQEEAKAWMVMAQEQAKWYYDLNHQKVPFKIGNKVWIKGKDIKIHMKKPLSDKLAAKQHGPFVITHQYSAATFRVDLTYKYWKRHPVFHAQKLIPHNKDRIGNHEPSKPPPLDIEDNEDSKDPIYELEKVVNSEVIEDSKQNKHVCFEVKWKGYSNKENQYKTLWQLCGAKDLVCDYIKKNPNVPLPVSLTDNTPRDPPKPTPEMRQSNRNKK